MLTNIFSIVIIVSGGLMVLAILLQARGASLGAGFGSSSELYTTRRGTDKSLFDATIILAALFIAALMLSLTLG